MTTMTAERAITQIQKRAEEIKSNAPQRFPEAASIGDSHRQGDIYLTLLDGVPDGAKKVPFRAQLADGETQGSRHCLASSAGVTMYTRKNPTNLEGPVFVLATENVVEHPEHGHVILPANVGGTCYGITYQRNLDAMEREQRVLD